MRARGRAGGRAGGRTGVYVGERARGRLVRKLAGGSAGLQGAGLPACGSAAGRAEVRALTSVGLASVSELVWVPRQFCAVLVVSCGVLWFLVVVCGFLLVSCGFLWWFVGFLWVFCGSLVGPLRAYYFRLSSETCLGKVMRMRKHCA